MSYQKFIFTHVNRYYFTTDEGIYVNEALTLHNLKLGTTGLIFYRKGNCTSYLHK